MSDNIESMMWTLASRHNKNGAEAANDFRQRLVELIAEIDKNPDDFIGGILLAAVERRDENDAKVGTELHGGIAGTATAIAALDHVLSKQLEKPRRTALEQRLKAQMAAEQLEEAKNGSLGKLISAMLEIDDDECDCAGCTENRRQEERAATKH